ncbi:129_t:CDS:2 [Funneliformis caledonium]|uniref:129_t:CDS:1 n=1 Tax=Funneliformis caledonium TaxID=1117310 RepID=A0A9N8VIK6_9GLOM|nr:129_t:CDS:2 [Funneliformis caledonium]
MSSNQQPSKNENKQDDTLLNRVKNLPTQNSDITSVHDFFNGYLFPTPPKFEIEPSISDTITGFNVHREVGLNFYVKTAMSFLKLNKLKRWVLSNRDGLAGYGFQWESFFNTDLEVN